jgi:hypothetical protein
MKQYVCRDVRTGVFLAGEGQYHPDLTYAARLPSVELWELAIREVWRLTPAKMVTCRIFEEAPDGRLILVR